MADVIELPEYTKRILYLLSSRLLSLVIALLMVASHNLALAEQNVGKQKLHRDPGNVRHGGRHTPLQAFHRNVLEPQLL